MVAYPISAKTTPSLRVNGWSSWARLMNRVQFRPDIPSPRSPRPDANSSTVPRRAKARPRLPSTRNFHAASSEVSRLWKATRKTDTRVVSSTAIQRIPRLLETATSSIANT